MIYPTRLVFIIGTVLLIAGCGSLGTQAPVEEGGHVDKPEERIIVAPIPATRISPPKTPLSTPAQSVGAVSKLSLVALSEYRSGKYTNAAATLERALRIAPRNASIWNQLATVRLQQKKWRLALNMAAKSNALAVNQEQLQRQNWLIMAKAYRALGQIDKADEAMQRTR